MTMARVAVIGEELRAQGFRLAGAVICPAADPAAARLAWRSLPADVAVVVVTPTSAAWLGDELSRRPEVLPVVMPAAMPTEIPTGMLAGMLAGMPAAMPVVMSS